MSVHPQLWPAIASAIIGAPLIALASLCLARRWRALKVLWRCSLLAALAVVEGVYFLNIYAWFIEPRLLVVRRIDIESAHWQGPPMSIAALSDTHVGSPHVDARRVGRVVQRINALRPDLVVLLGDYVGGHLPRHERSAAEQAEINSGIAVFGALDARYGAVAVIGNHDSWYDRGEIAADLENAGVAVLWNRHVVIARQMGPLPSGRFVVAGLADKDTGDPDYARAIDGAPTGAPVIVLTHNPDVFPRIPDRPALTIASHTHCGQVTVPLLGRLVVPSVYGQRFACGLVVERGRKMFVTGGLGTSVQPLRFLNPPEFVLITLRAAAPSPSHASAAARRGRAKARR